VHTAAGTTGYDLVVAADGINSITRQQLWPYAKPARRTGITAWRWISDTPPPQFIGLVWGVRAEFGVLPLAGNRTYAYAGTGPGAAGLSEFADWPHPVPQLVAAAAPQRIIRNDLLELPIPKSWVQGRVALLGDAAHGMRPTLGQGAGMALEDAVTLAATAPDLAAYALARARRVRRIAAISRKGSWLAEPESTAVARFRDRTATIMPTSLLLSAGRMSMRKVVNNWTPPTALARAGAEATCRTTVPTKGASTMDRDGGPPVVLVDNVSRHYRTGGGNVDALTNVTLSINGGEFVSIIGPSGAGKSTLLHLIGALDRPGAGSITVDGNRLESLDDGAQSKFRLNHVGFVFQFFNLLPHLSAWENVALPRLYGGARLGGVREEALALLGRVGMENRAEHRPGELSGGQMQRVAIARALVMSPRVVLADEPTGNLDSKSGHDILALLREVTESDGRVVVMVTHDADAAAVADRTVEMRDGAVIAEHRRPRR
jgi:putative ABC transport system ATP-binding protein